MTNVGEDAMQFPAYQAASQHWAHAEQIRWTLLYNYLMASTILLLAWATIFTAQTSGLVRYSILAALAGAGAGLSALWVALGARATSFVRMYASAGEVIESTLPPPRDHGSEILTPFARASRHRRSITGVARLAPSHVVLWAVPIVFLLLDLGLLYVSLRGVLGPGRPIPWYVTVAAAIAYVAYAGISLRHLHLPGSVQYKQLIVGAGALIEEDGKLLLLKRATAPFVGLWGLPGGHVEASEDPQRAAIRESQEETGLNVASHGVAGVYFFDDHPRGAGIFVVYRCTVAGGQPKPSAEASCVRYFAPPDVPHERAGGGHSKAIEDWLARRRGA